MPWVALAPGRFRAWPAPRPRLRVVKAAPKKNPFVAMALSNLEDIKAGLLEDLADPNYADLQASLQQQLAQVNEALATKQPAAAATAATTPPASTKPNPFVSFSPQHLQDVHAGILEDLADPKYSDLAPALQQQLAQVEQVMQTIGLEIPQSTPAPIKPSAPTTPNPYAGLSAAQLWNVHDVITQAIASPLTQGSIPKYQADLALLEQQMLAAGLIKPPPPSPIDSLQQWEKLMDLAQAAAPKMQQALTEAFEWPKLPAGVQQSLVQGQVAQALSQMADFGMQQMESSYVPAFSALTEKLFTDVAAAQWPALKEVLLQSDIDFELPTKLPDDIMVQRALRYVREEGLKRAKNLWIPTIEASREIIRVGLAEGKTTPTIARELRQHIGLLPGQDKQLMAYNNGLIEAGMPQAKIDTLTEKFAAKLLRRRTTVIARTETAAALNVAADTFFEAAKEAAGLPATALRRFWLITFDGRTCPICRAIPEMNEDGHLFQEPFLTPSGPHMRPPAHPQCRCVVIVRPTLIAAPGVIPQPTIPAPPVLPPPEAPPKAKQPAKPKKPKAAPKDAYSGLTLGGLKDTEAVLMDDLDATSDPGVKAGLEANLKLVQAHIGAKGGVPATYTPAPAVPVAPRAGALTATDVIEEAAAKGTLLRDLGGSTGAQQWQGTDGVVRGVKGPKTQQAYQEFLANKLYKELGVDAPEQKLTMKGGQITGVASDWIEGETLEKAGLTQDRARSVLKGFVADVWLMNRDAVGLTLDNIIVQGNKTIRLDNGGSLLFRAQGSLKNKDDLGKLNEWQGLQSRSLNRAYADVFQASGYGTPENIPDLLDQVKALQALRDRTNGFSDLVPAAPGVSAAQRTELVTLLRKRARLLEEQVGLAAPVPVRDIPAEIAALKQYMGSDRYTRLLSAVRREGTVPVAMHEHEAVAIWDYTGNAYTEMNRPFWSSRDATTRARERQERAPLIDAAMSGLPSLEQGKEATYYRGVQDLTTDYIARMSVPGAIVELEGFASTTTKKQVAVRKFSGDRHLFVIKGKGGNYNVQPISQLGTSEAEYLYPPSARFRVLKPMSHDPDTNAKTFWLEEIPDVQKRRPTSKAAGDETIYPEPDPWPVDFDTWTQEQVDAYARQLWADLDAHVYTEEELKAAEHFSAKQESARTVPQPPTD